MRTKVSEKGQITVPKGVREQLGIRAGDELDVSAEEGNVVARKALPQDPVASVYGILAGGQSTDDIIRELRGDPDAT
jgi:antitoxin PrlF